jgi:hypothetical protein
MGTRSSVPGGKAARAWSWPLTSTIAEVKNVWSYTSILPIQLYFYLSHYSVLIDGTEVFIFHSCFKTLSRPLYWRSATA